MLSLTLHVSVLSVLGKLLLKSQHELAPQLNYIRTDETLIHQVLCEKEVKY